MAVSLGGMTQLAAMDTVTDENAWTGTDGLDAYNFSIQGTNSESFQVSKNATETGIFARTATLDATRGLFVVWCASSISAIYTSIKVRVRSTAGNEKIFTLADTGIRSVDGAFRAFAMDYVNKGIETGTFVPASFSEFDFEVSTANINFRAVPNHWIDVVNYGAGHTLSGTTVGDKLFTEAADLDVSGDTYYGILENYNGVIYSQGDIDLSGTALVSSGETLVFKDTANGYSSYNLDVTGTATFTNTAIVAAGAIDYNFDSSAATSFTQTGGSHTGYATFITAAGQAMSGVVFQDGGTTTIANDLDEATFNLSGTITVTGSLTNSTINKSTGSSAVTTADLAKVTLNSFISDGTGHAVDLGTIAATTSVTWSNTLTDYAATNGSTGNEAILVNVASGQTLTINVSGGTTPTYYNTGAGTVVVSASVSVTVTVTTSDGTPIAGASVYLKTVGGTVVLNGVTNASGVIAGSYGGSTPAVIDTTVSGVKDASKATPYSYFTLGGQIESTGYSQTALMSED